jgi:hypothetical protein
MPAGEVPATPNGKVASATLRCLTTDLLSGNRSRSIISVLESTITKSASRGSNGIFVHRNHWTAKKQQRRLRTLPWADNTSQKANLVGYQAWNECWRAILSDCLEQRFEMVARPRFEPINRIALHS